ncbi:protein FLC EXPRESSOR [Cynara cardunculus var. scolymus]|uniref:protein FLC EXPRESSOR n=1 Tax=Cynara cardunculus var. scolymus TaxID=59895 RepID=UPI000D629EDC|nr:protein FLC EXPRESSOR [Cynara cardunculus var. scolymus]
MEGRNYIPPSLLLPRQGLQPLTVSSAPARYVIGDRYYVQHREMQSLLIDNHRLMALHVSLQQELSAARKELRHLSSDVDKVKAERDAQLREVYERLVNLEAQVKSIDESKAELVEVQRDLQKLRSENEELDDKLNKLRRDVAKESLEWHKIPMLKAELEAMQEENQRGREAIEQERKIHAMNTKESQAMENYRMFMAGEIEKLKVEAVDAEKRARAAAAAEAVSIPGTGYGAGYGNRQMGYAAVTLGNSPVSICSPLLKCV